MKPQFNANPAYNEYELLLKPLHEFIAIGQEDSPEAGTLYNRMDDLESQLTQIEIQRLNGLSADLYMLYGNEILESPEMPKEEIAAALARAHEHNDWEQTLRLLRKQPRFFSIDKVAYLRARAYDELGHLATSLLFMEHAAKIDTQNESYRYFILEKLGRLHRYGEAETYAKQFIESGNSSPGFRIQYAYILFASTKELSTTDAKPIWTQILALLDVALEGGSHTAEAAVYMVAGFLVQGSCYEGLGQVEAAIEAYTRALTFDPANTDALTLRGLLWLQMDPSNAIIDFKSAVKNNAPEIAPYLYVAYDALIRNDFETCILTCRKVRVRTDQPNTLAIVYQWTAIAEYHMGVPINNVVRTAKAASDLDPLNPLLDETLQIFRFIQNSPQDWNSPPELIPAHVSTVYRATPDLRNLMHMPVAA